MKRSIVLGSTGRLGQALVNSFPADNVLAPPRAVYQDWWRAGSERLVTKYIRETGNTSGVIYIAVGIIDPRAPSTEHDKINYQLPINLINGAAECGHDVVTFGTVMEGISGINPTNPYIASKKKLSSHIEAMLPPDMNVTHLRLHTLFGGRQPDSFMFLGQILDALLLDREFNMSPGFQLREYHHIDDEVLAIHHLVSNGAKGVHSISNGNPVMLRDLAAYLFKHFNAEHLLRIGNLEAPPAENYETIFEKSIDSSLINFRDALPAIASYLLQWIKNEKK